MNVSGEGLLCGTNALHAAMSEVGVTATWDEVLQHMRSISPEERFFNAMVIRDTAEHFGVRLYFHVIGAQPIYPPPRLDHHWPAVCLYAVGVEGGHYQYYSQAVSRSPCRDEAVLTRNETYAEVASRLPNFWTPDGSIIEPVTVDVPVMSTEIPIPVTEYGPPITLGRDLRMNTPSTRSLGRKVREKFLPRSRSFQHRPRKSSLSSSSSSATSSRPPRGHWPRGAAGSPVKRDASLSPEDIDIRKEVDEKLKRVRRTARRHLEGVIDQHTVKFINSCVGLVDPVLTTLRRKADQARIIRRQWRLETASQKMIRDTKAAPTSRWFGKQLGAAEFDESKMSQSYNRYRRLKAVLGVQAKIENVKRSVISGAIWFAESFAEDPVGLIADNCISGESWVKPHQLANVRFAMSEGLAEKREAHIARMPRLAADGSQIPVEFNSLTTFGPNTLRGRVPLLNWTEAVMRSPARSAPDTPIFVPIYDPVVVDPMARFFNKWKKPIDIPLPETPRPSGYFNIREGSPLPCHKSVVHFLPWKVDFKLLHTKVTERWMIWPDDKPDVSSPFDDWPPDPYDDVVEDDLPVRSLLENIAIRSFKMVGIVRLLLAQPLRRCNTVYTRLKTLMTHLMDITEDWAFSAFVVLSDALDLPRVATRTRVKPAHAPQIPGGRARRLNYQHWTRLRDVGDLALGDRNYDTIVNWYHTNVNALVQEGFAPVPVDENFVTRVNRNVYVDYHLEYLKTHDSLFDDIHPWVDHSVFADREALKAVTARYFVVNEHELPPKLLAEYIKLRFHREAPLFCNSDIAKPSKILHNLNKKSSPGWPFMARGYTKRHMIRSGAWETVLRLADIALASDDHIRDVFQVKPKSIVSKGLRTITASNIVAHINAERFAISTKERHDPYGSSAQAGLATTGWGFNETLRRFEGMTYSISLDASRFDSTAHAVLSVPRELRKMGFRTHPDYANICRLIDAVYLSLEDTYLVDVIDDGSHKPAVYEKNTGIATGHSSVTFDNSEALPAAIYIPLSMYTGWSLSDVYDRFKIINMGDDNEIFTNVAEGQITPSGKVFKWTDFFQVVEDSTGIMLRVEGEAKGRDGVEFLSKTPFTMTTAQRDELKSYGVENADALKYWVTHNRKSLKTRYVNLRQDGYHVAIYRRDATKLTYFLKGRVLGMVPLTAGHHDLYLFLEREYHRYFDLISKRDPQLARSLAGKKEFKFPAYATIMRTWYTAPKHNPGRFNRTHRQARLDTLFFRTYELDRKLRDFRKWLGRIDPEMHDFPVPDMMVLPKSAFDPTYEVERFVFKSMLFDNAKDGLPCVLPSFQDFVSRLRESPFYGTTAAEAFYRSEVYEILRSYENLDLQQMRRDVGKHRMRMTIASLLYSGLVIAFYSTPAGILSVGPVLFDIYRNGIRRLYSYLGYAYWLDKARGSIEISNMVPKDMFGPFKCWSMKLLSMIPQSTPLPDYKAVPLLNMVDMGAIYEFIARLTNVGQSFSIGSDPDPNLSLHERGLQQDEWRTHTEACIKTALNAPNRAVVLSSATGTGKTTMFTVQASKLACFIDVGKLPRFVQFAFIIILVPRRSLVSRLQIKDGDQDVVNRILGGSDTTRIRRGINVMTYGHAKAVRNTLPPDALYILDEFHEQSPDQLFMNVIFARRSWLRVIMSATPTFELTSEVFETYETRMPTRHRITRVDLPTVSPITVANRILTDERSRLSFGKKILIIHPSTRAVDYIAASLRENLETYQNLGFCKIAEFTAAKRHFPEDATVIVASNIARTGDTIPGVTCVIDSGFMISNHLGDVITCNNDADISTQTAGRTGRTCDGVYFRCLDEPYAPRPVEVPPPLEAIIDQAVYVDTKLDLAFEYVPWTFKAGYIQLNAVCAVESSAKVQADEFQSLDTFVQLVSMHHTKGLNDAIEMARQEYFSLQENRPLESVAYFATLKKAVSTPVSRLVDIVSLGNIVFQTELGTITRQFPSYSGRTVTRHGFAGTRLPRAVDPLKVFTALGDTLNEKVDQAIQAEIDAAPAVSAPTLVETATSLTIIDGRKLPKTAAEAREEFRERRRAVIAAMSPFKRSSYNISQCASAVARFCVHADLSPLKAAGPKAREVV